MESEQVQTHNRRRLAGMEAVNTATIRPRNSWEESQLRVQALLPGKAESST